MPGCVPGSTEGTLHKSDSDLLAHFPFPNFSQCSHPNNFPDLPSDCILIMFLTGESFSQSQGWWLTSSAKQTSGMVPATGSNGCLFSQRDRDPVFTSLAYSFVPGPCSAPAFYGCTWEAWPFYCRAGFPSSKRGEWSSNPGSCLCPGWAELLLHVRPREVRMHDGAVQGLWAQSSFISG